MCKYNNYAIEILFLNGNKHLKEAENNTSYKETMSLYHDVKEDYMDKDVRINFLGFTEDGEQGVIFSKKNTIIGNEKKNIEDLIKTIYESATQLQELYKIISGKEDYYNKKKSNIDHLLVEAIDIEEFTEEEKAKVFDEIREVNLMRRDYKLLNNIRRHTYKELDIILKRSKFILNKYEDFINTSNNKLKSLIQRDDKSVESHLVKEIKYKDFKHRINIMKNIEKKYDRIIHIPEKKILACYNKCYGKTS